jgi:hypothetical protein
MAGIKVEYELSDGGSTKNLNNATSLLRENMDGVTAAATRASAAAKSAMAASAAPKTANAIKAASASTADKVDMYDQARAGVGTGAASRDFAKQAQGLGGLVRVYATFAANLFAVTAAFTALKEAANTENMVKGLDQLSAAGGQSLGTLSKQIAATTGGALSLRDAMTAVAQASSAGLGTKQIQDIAVVAGKASQALGISMTDAVSRLSRGISKIEPELLDEIGIFVKVDDAVNRYALSVGKTVTSLSDFERRQAFANAVLEQGKQKFAAIEAAPNPYDKLLASASNLLTAGLQVINKVLTPILDILAQSPTALTAVFGLIAITLLKQAIPAIGAWREELTKSADVAAKTAQKSYEAFRDYSIAKNLEREAKDIVPIQQRINANIAGAQTELAKTLSDKSKILSQAMSGTVDPQAMDKLVSTEVARRTTILEKIKATAAADATASAAKKSAYAETIALQEKEIARLQVASTLYKEVAADRQLIAARQANTDNAAATREEKNRKIIADSLTNKATSAGILAQVGSDTNLKGTKEAFRSLLDNVKNGIPIFDETGKTVGRATSGLKGLGAAATIAKGSLVILGSAIGTAFSAASGVLQAIGVLVGIYQLLNSVASSATKQQDEFNTKVEENNNAVKTVNDTFKLYTTAKKEAFGIEGISAFTTALSGVTKSFDEQLDALNRFRKAAGVWDKLKDDVAGIFGKSNTDEIKKNAVDSIQAILKSLQFSSGKENAKSILGQVVPKEALEDTEELKKAIGKLNDADLSKLASSFKMIEESQQFSTNAAKGFLETLKSINKTVDQIIQSNAFTDLQGKLGVDLVNAADQFAQALTDPLKSVAVLEEITKNPKLFAIIGPEQIESLFKARTIVTEIGKQEKEVEKLRQEFEKFGPATENLSGNYDALGNAIGESLGQSNTEIRNELESNYKAAEASLTGLKTKAEEFSMSQANLVKTLTDEGFKRIALGLKEATQKAQNSIKAFDLGQAASAGLNTANEEYKLKMADIRIQTALVEASYVAELATRKNTEKLEKLTVELELARAQAARTNPKATEDEKKVAGLMAISAQEALDKIKAKEDLNAGESVKNVEAKYGTKAVQLAQSSITNDKIPEIKKQAALSGLKADTVIAGKTRDIKNEEYAFKLKSDGRTLDLESLKLQELAINNAQQITNIGTVGLLDAKEELQLEILAQETSNQRKKIEEEIRKINKSITPELKETADAELKIERSKLEQLGISELIKEASIKDSSIRAKSADREAQLTKEAEIRIQNEQDVNSIKLAQISLYEKQIDAQLQLGTIDDKSAVRKKAEYELQRLILKAEEDENKAQDKVDLKAEALVKAKEILQRADESQRQLKALQDSYLKQRQDALESGTVTAENLATLPTVSVEAQQKVDNEKELAKAVEARAQSEYNAAIRSKEAIAGVNELSKQSIEDQKALSLELIKQADHLSNISNITNSLSAVFGDFGKTLGDVISKFDTMYTNDQKRAEQLKNAVKGTKEYSDLERKNTQAQLADGASLIGSAKSLFKEKSTTYKTMAALEKGIHIVNMAMSAQRMVQQSLETGGLLANIGTRITATVAAAEVDGVAGVVKSVASLPFPVNVAAGVTVAAIMAALIGQIGGKGPGYTNAATNTGTGVGGGDNSSPSESLAKSIEILAPADPIMMKNSSEMVRYLRNISDNIGNFGLALSRAGVLEGNAAAAKTGFNTTSTSNMLLWGGQFIRDIGGALGLGTVMDSLSKALGFGTKTSIEGQGITAGPQSIGSIRRSGFSGNFYTNIKEEDKALGITYSSSTRTVLTGFTKELSDALTNVFDSVGNAIFSSAEILGKDSVDVMKKIDAFVVNFGSVGIGGDASKTIENIAGQQLDLLVQSVLPEMEPFNKQGERLGETLSRVVFGIDSASVALDNIGIEAIKYTDIINKKGDVGAEIVRQSILAGETQSLIKDVIKNANGTAEDVAELYTKLDTLRDTIVDLGIDQEFLNRSVIIAAGGVDKFSEGINTFFGKFTTEAYKTSIEIDKAKNAFSKFGVAIPATREEFFELFNTLSTTSPEAAGGLLKVIDSIDTMYTSTEAILEKQKSAWESFFGTFASASQKTFNETLKITTVFNKFGLAIPKTRGELLTLVDGLRTTAPDTADAIMELSSSFSTYYSAAGSFENVTLSLSNSLKTTTESLKSQIKALKDYDSSLVLGSQSTLTATEQYSFAKDEVTRLKGIIDSTPTTAAEEKTRNEAIGSFTKATDNFLRLSSSLYASGAQYSSDFNLVRTAIKNTSAALETQLTDAEKQLAKLTESNSFLEDISNSSKTTSELITKYLELGGVSITAPKAALGTNYVPHDMLAQIHEGERIMPAADNAMLMQNLNSGNSSNQQLLTQIAQLTKQVEDLAAVVADGAILNAKATDRNTEQITKVITTSNDKTIQANRLQAKAGIK